MRLPVLRAPGVGGAPSAESPRAPSRAMLPWKRHRLELSSSSSGPGATEAEREQPGSSSSSSGGLVPGALGRVGRLLGWRRRRRTFSVSGGRGESSLPPSFRALYLGHAATLQAKGEGCAEAALGRLWARSRAGKEGARVRLSLGPHGLRLVPDDGAGGEPPSAGQLYLLPRVTHCAADARLPGLLAWVYRHEARHKAVVLRCHAALLPKAAHARALALRLRESADAALRELRRRKRRSDARHQRRLRLLRHPERGLPGEGGGAEGREPRQAPDPRRAPPRLGAIAEDPDGEEREAEEEEDGGRLVRGLRRMGLAEDSPDGRDPATLANERSEKEESPPGPGKARPTPPKPIATEPGPTTDSRLPGPHRR